METKTQRGLVLEGRMDIQTVVPYQAKSMGESEEYWLIMNAGKPGVHSDQTTSLVVVPEIDPSLNLSHGVYSNRTLSLELTQLEILDMDDPTTVYLAELQKHFIDPDDHSNKEAFYTARFKRANINGASNFRVQLIGDRQDNKKLEKLIKTEQTPIFGIRGYKIYRSGGI